LATTAPTGTAATTKKQKAKATQEEAIENLSKEINEVSHVVKLNSLLLLAYAANVVSKYLDMKMQKYGQDLTRLNILYLLVGSGGSMTPTNISKRVYRSKHAISRALDVLEKDALIARARTSSDRRSVNIIITRKGVQLVRKSLPDLKQASAAATSCLTTERTEDLKTISRDLRNHLINLMGPTA
jgi:DNA-binding MarR family transcriptional regulator